MAVVGLVVGVPFRSVTTIRPPVADDCEEDGTVVLFIAITTLVVAVVVVVELDVAEALQVGRGLDTTSARAPVAMPLLPAAPVTDDDPVEVPVG